MRLLIIKKKWLIWGGIGILALIVLLIYLGDKVIETNVIPSTAKGVIIDAGHGGIDPGKVGSMGNNEKDINLSIARYLREYLEQSGSVVLMTRDSDVGLYTEGGTVRKKKNEDLQNRKKIVKESQADIFITIHVNSFTQSQYSGAQTFYPKNNPMGKRLAGILQEELVNVLDPNNKRVALEKEGIYLIRDLEIPTVLVECGFLSNPKEEKLLNDSQYQQRVAWALYIGIQRYFQETH
ncbi:N-acetylmuramoyl-L-alanine amidase CwlD [Alkaliphilus metalliredigens QYMF]|uniref:N-acetylmuramoyl-L-alanine amidase CwlD n=1 Tax=Alkaliphilus metalliredigens (strain QYMF) TaxID=293826 RepID=A6TWE4_ALKMQ|nr:N-acetylmuramoyl-L-alanine amidase CwlD [Alkaliphilus metalliredigens QYMF]